MSNSIFNNFLNISNLGLSLPAAVVEAVVSYMEEIFHLLFSALIAVNIQVVLLLKVHFNSLFECVKRLCFRGLHFTISPNDIGEVGKNLFLVFASFEIL